MYFFINYILLLFYIGNGNIIWGVKMKQKIVTIVLSIVIFIVPMLIIPTSSKDYNLLRYILLLACGATLLIMFLLFILNSGKKLFDEKDVLIFGFGAIAILSTVFSLNVKQSIIGASNRYEGVLTILTYILIYYSAKYHFKKYKYFEDIAIGVYLAILIFAIVQFYMPSEINVFPIFGRGAHGTFGNTNFMGSFVSIVLPALIISYIFNGKKLYLTLSLIGFLVMLMCIARSSWVAFIITSLIGIIYLIVKKDKNYWKRFLILLIGFIICFSILTIKNDKNIIILNKINIIQDEFIKAQNTGLSSEMGSSRIEIWTICLKLLKKVPIFGCGVDSLEYGLREFTPIEDMAYRIKYNVYIDKAHNEYLHIAATMGIPAAIIYIIFIMWILIPNIKNMFKDKKCAFFSIIIISYLVQALFNISTIGVAPIFWFILGRSSSTNKMNN